MMKGRFSLTGGRGAQIAVMVGVGLAAPGCTFIGMMAASAEREGSSTRAAEYDGLYEK